MTGEFSPKKAKSSIVLTFADLKDPCQSDARKNHEQSQGMLMSVLRHRGLRTRTSRGAFFVEEDHDPTEHERLAFTKRVLGRLKERGIHGIRTFRLMLHTMDLERNGTCLGRTFEGALAHMGVRLKFNEYEVLMDLFGMGEEEEMVDYVHFLSYGCSNWSSQRQEVVQEAYDFLRELCPGKLLTVAAIEIKFRPEALSSQLVPELLEHHSAQEFLSQWSNSVVGADGIVTWLDFVDYYLDVSLCFDQEQGFCQFVCKSWGIDMDDWLAKKVFKRFATGEDEDTLPAKDFIRMLDELDPTITEEEAMAWYEAIDEDDSGEVSLEEFLQSKVLKVKRLFDQFDDDNTRTASGDVFTEILHSLNEAITDEEAVALYQYADMDGNGEISFMEFLENNLLKMLQIFDEFDKYRTRSFNEAEMKMLLRKLDPYLDDYDIHSIYKAIDTDGSGSISFVEFVESHVLRAKLLFDRYDTDRSRTLTQFKFRELMFDMDGTLTTSQMEAIYNLVADQNSGKVHLGGFLNPNIVKLKLLFDKYDTDRSRYLDAQQFKEMLKELFNSASDHDIQALQHTVTPPGSDQGVTFTHYIQIFKEISRKHDLLQLAKRRQAREKRRAKGLVLNNEE